jgi:hypothetical protein
MGDSRWYGVSIKSRSWNISNSCLTAAVLNLRLPVTSDSIVDGGIEFPDPENMGTAFEIMFLCVMDAEIRLVEYVGKLRIEHLRFSWNWPLGEKMLSQELYDIFGLCFRCNVRLFIGEEYLKAHKNIRRRKMLSWKKHRVGGSGSPPPPPTLFGSRWLIGVFEEFIIRHMSDLACNARWCSSKI